MSGQTVIVTESERTKLRESETKGRWRVQLIEADVQGSSGYYPASVLERDIAKAFPAGTHIFLDHPTESEEWDRPERSVRDLVGVLVKDAWYENGSDGHGGFGDMQVFPDYKKSVEAWAPYVGMSIRAMGLVDEANHVTELIRGESVDIVTRAGAGGRLVTMTESARQSAGKELGKPLYAELQEGDRNAMVTLNENMGQLAGVVNSLTEKISKLEEKAAVKEQSDVLTPGEIYAKLSSAGLPQVVTKRLADGYKKGVDLDARIAEEQSIIAELTAELQGTVDAASVEAPEADKGEAPAEAPAMAEVTESARLGRTQTLQESKGSAFDSDSVLDDIFEGGL